jgi:hypothetical protein
MATVQVVLAEDEPISLDFAAYQLWRLGDVYEIASSLAVDQPEVLEKRDWNRPETRLSPHVTKITYGSPFMALMVMPLAVARYLCGLLVSVRTVQAQVGLANEQHRTAILQNDLLAIRNDVLRQALADKCIELPDNTLAHLLTLSELLPLTAEPAVNDDDEPSGG